MTPIKDYALIGNCETAALVNPSGGIDWLCLPAFDSPSFFARLLDDAKGGYFTLHPTESFETEQSYFEDSAILQTRFTTKSGVVRLTDFFVVARKANARFYDFTSLHPARKLVRLIELEEGTSVPMQMRVEARPDYARQAPLWPQKKGGGYETEVATLFSNIAIKPSGEDLLGNFDANKSKAFFVVLDYGNERRLPEVTTIHEWLRVTKAFWREWNLFNYYRGPHEKLLRRSAVTLKLLTYAQTGAFVAAPTTSLPEQIGDETNWDYRFTWVRDTSLFIQALFGIGYSGEASAFLDFAVAKWIGKNKEKGGNKDDVTVDVYFPIGDTPAAEETELDHLAGYQDSRPVRFGNRAGKQFQLDNYGHLLQSLFSFRHTGGKIDATKRKMIERLVEETIRFWKRDDNGIWEEEKKFPFTYGKVMCWLALARGRDLRGDKDGEIKKACEAISSAIRERGLTAISGQKILSDKLDAPAVDASALLAFTTGFLSEDLARSTREVIERCLGRDPLIYRRDKSVEKEGAFLLCSFWWINHLIREGHLKRAEEMLNRIIGMASPLGLFSEEIDPKTGEFLGNFPQAFSHLGLIQTILNLENSKKRPGFHALPDHEKFQRSVGATIGLKGVIAGLCRVPKTAMLFYSRASKWRGQLIRQSLNHSSCPVETQAAHKR